MELVFDANRTATILSNPMFQPDPSDPDAVRNLFTRGGTEYYFLCPLRYLSRQMARNKNTYNFRFNVVVIHLWSAPAIARPAPVVSVTRLISSRSLPAAPPCLVFHKWEMMLALQDKSWIDSLLLPRQETPPNPMPGQQGVELTNADVTGLNWLPYDNSNPILELNVQSSLSTNAENDMCTWIDNLFLYDFSLKIPGNAP